MGHKSRVNKLYRETSLIPDKVLSFEVHLVRVGAATGPKSWVSMAGYNAYHFVFVCHFTRILTVIS